MQHEFKLTDSSSELAQVGRKIRGSDKVKGQNVLVGFASCFGVDPSSHIFFDLLSVVRSRIYALEHFAKNVTDPELDQNLRGDVVAATQLFSQLFLPQHLTTVWDNNRVTFVPDANIKTLMWFGQTARRHRPLRVITDEERKNLIEKVDEVLGDLADGDISRWAIAPLSEGLLRLRTILQFFEFFGHELAIDELLIFNRKVEAIRDASRSVDGGLGSYEFPTMSKILNISALLGTLFILPDQAVTAYDRYVGWQKRMIESSTQKPDERLLIAPPRVALPRLPSGRKDEAE